MSADDALIRLGHSTADAVSGVLERFAPGKVHAGDVRLASNPLDAIPMPAVATSVSYVDGVTGGNVFVMPLEGRARASPRR